jgi:hypothetical protein
MRAFNELAEQGRHGHFFIAVREFLEQSGESLSNRSRKRGVYLAHLRSEVSGIPAENFVTTFASEDQFYVFGSATRE